MTVDSTWGTIPGYSNFQILRDRTKGIKVRSRRRRRPGGTRTMGGVILLTNNGRYRLKVSAHADIDHLLPDDIWAATFQGKPLIAQTAGGNRKGEQC